MSPTKVLVIDDDPAMLELAKFHLLEQGYEVFSAETSEQGMKLIETDCFDLALTDLNLPDLDGIELVKRIKAASPDTEIVMITGYGSVAKAVGAINAGAFYYVEKPIDFGELLALLEKALERRQQSQEIRRLRGRLAQRSSYYHIIGSSKAMQKVYEIIESVADSDANVLIIGESGTGKELAANAIHYRSRRAKKPMLQVNCAALPKELIESELFGHTKGAFTGATTEKVGLIGRAAGGSLFLDEIGEMPLELQPKLLRVLQERVYFRLGSEKPLESDFRLITATNRDPLDAIKVNHLREDLYYRINTIELRVPPLRERAEDIQLLADHFLRQFAEKYQRPVTAISEQAYECIFDYHWPGNVRELQNVVERAVLLCKDQAIDIHHLPFARTKTPTISQVRSITTETAVANTQHAVPQKDYTLEQLCQMIIDVLPEPQLDEPMKELFKQLEIYLAKAALARTKGNKQAAANLLGIYRPRLYNLLKKQGDLESSADEEKLDKAAVSRTASARQ